MRKFIYLLLLLALIVIPTALAAPASTLEITGTPILTSCDFSEIHWTGTLLSWSVESGYQVVADEFINNTIFNAGQILATGPSTGSLGPGIYTYGYTVASYPYNYVAYIYLSNGIEKTDEWQIAIKCSALNTGTISYSRVNLNSASASATDDPDGDGISSNRDNCPHDYNPDQEDGWGSAMGDLCDTDWYNYTGNGIAGFPQKEGTFNLHGNCTYMADGDPRCPVIASFDPSSFTPDSMPMHFETNAAGTMSVVVHYLHNNHGADVYQVNIYSTNPPQPDSLVDDRLELHVTGGSWQWHMRGGDSAFNGI